MILSTRRNIMMIYIDNDDWNALHGGMGKCRLVLQGFRESTVFQQSYPPRCLICMAIPRIASPTVQPDDAGHAEPAAVSQQSTLEPGASSLVAVKIGSSVRCWLRRYGRSMSGVLRLDFKEQRSQCSLLSAWAAAGWNQATPWALQGSCLNIAFLTPRQG